MGELTRDEVINCFRDYYQGTVYASTTNQIAARAMQNDYSGNTLYEKILSWLSQSDQDRSISLIELTIAHDVHTQLLEDDDKVQAERLERLLRIRAGLIGNRTVINPTEIILATEQISQALDDLRREQRIESFFKKLDQLKQILGTDDPEKLAQACHLPAEVVKTVILRHAADPNYCPHYFILTMLFTAVRTGLREPVASVQET